MAMGKMEVRMAKGWASIVIGVFLYADAIGCGRAYGYTTGSVFEFVLGTLAVIGGAMVIHVAGVYRDRARHQAGRTPKKAIICLGPKSQRF